MVGQQVTQLCGMKNNEPQNSPVINPLYQESGNFFLKGQIINILGLVSNAASASTLQFCFCSMKAGVDLTQMGTLLQQLFIKNRQRAGCDLQAIVSPPLPYTEHGWA